MSSEGHFRIDTTRVPLIWVEYQGTISNDAFEQYLKDYSAVLDRGEPYGAIFDASASGAPSAAQRRMQADWLKENEARLKSLCQGGAFVIRSPLIRGAMTAILWLQSMPFPHVVVGDVSEAADWLCPRLGLTVASLLGPVGPRGGE